MSRRTGFEDENAIVAQTERAILVIFAVHGVFAGGVLPEFQAVDTQVADREVFVHIEEGSVDSRHRIVFLRHFGGLRSARFVRERQRVVRRIRDFQYENLLIRGEQLLSLEPALFQHHAVEGVVLPGTVHKSQRVALGVEAKGENEEC